jgi:hypothetical protein
MESSAYASIFHSAGRKTTFGDAFMLSYQTLTNVRSTTMSRS